MGSSEGGATLAEHVAIAGGGLAGLTCAKYLADAGFEVTLIEGQPYLGGRASTFRDADGDWVEQGLHLFLGAYSEFQRLLCEIGQPPDEVLCWMSEVRLQDPQGAQATFGINPLRAPVKTITSFLPQNDFLGPLDKLSLLPMAMPGVLDMGSLQRAFDGQTVAEWWRQVNGSEEVMERFLRPFCRAIQFSDVDQFSAYNFLGWIHHVAYHLSDNFLGGYRGARDEIIFQPLARHLRGQGVKIRTGVELSEILLTPAGEGPVRVAGFGLAGGERLDADVYVAAVPAWAFSRLMPARLKADPFFRGIAELPLAPAISVQLWFDRPVVDTPDFTLVGRSLTPVYQDQTTNAYPNPRGSRVSVIVSPADALLDKPDSALVTLVLESLHQVEPRVQREALLKSVVLRHREHLIRPLPGAMSRRPTQITPVPNLFLAGDWTQQTYFGSQEGAVRGGKAAARAIVRALAPELRVSWLHEVGSRYQVELTCTSGNRKSRANGSSPATKSPTCYLLPLCESSQNGPMPLFVHPQIFTLRGCFSSIRQGEMPVPPWEPSQ